MASFVFILYTSSPVFTRSTYAYESNEPKATSPRSSSNANDALTSPPVLNCHSNLPLFALKADTLPSLPPITRILYAGEYWGEQWTSSGKKYSHFFFPVTASSATTPPFFFHKPNSSPTKTKPRSGAIQGEDPIQSASINIHKRRPVSLSNA